MYSFHRFTIAGILTIGVLFTSFTLFLPQKTTTAAMKAGPIWLGKPFAFSAVDFSSMDPPPGPWEVSANPWEMPARASKPFLLLADIAFFAFPLWILVFTTETAILLLLKRKH